MDSLLNLAVASALAEIALRIIQPKQPAYASFVLVKTMRHDFAFNIQWAE